MANKYLIKREKSSIRIPESNKKVIRVLERFDGNPIIEPRIEYWWESKATFNAAALYEGGRVHILYRAIGDSDVSVIGYASSTDGFHIDERLDKPVYIPREPFEGTGLIQHATYNPHVTYVSAEEEINGGEKINYVSGGGGYGGCEDPRLTKIDDRVYMTYVAFDGHNPPRVALTSISNEDFLSHNWQWKRPVLISSPGVVDKNACILPEKVQDKYVIFHRIFPDILIDIVDDLDFDGKTKWLKGEFKIQHSETYWDSRKVGVGAPPIKTNEGWLLIYQAVGECDPNRYKIGAMLLDLKDPTKVLARYKQPILEPQAIYENDGWKAGVVYPCGAVVINDRLIVYYGGADKVVCVASTRLKDLIDGLTSFREAIPDVPGIPSLFNSRAVVRKKSKITMAYCVKCRQNREVKDAVNIIFKNGRYAIQGICPVCRTKVFRLVKTKKHETKKQLSKREGP